MKIITLILLALAVVGCAPNTDRAEPVRFPILRNYIDQEVTVQFKRNELGLASNSVLSPTSTGLNHGMASLSGILKAVSEDGLLITGVYSVNQGSRAYTYESWVPMESVLHIMTHQEPFKP